MTRLIDADALIENHFSPSHRIALSYADKQWMRKIINEAPAVEAIPVDFIESWIDSNMVSTEDRDFYAEDCIRSLVQDWRKEE